MTEHIETIADDKNLCGEAPIWDGESQRLFWTDIESSIVYQFEPGSRKKSILMNDRSVSGITLHASGGLVLAGKKGMCVWHGPDDCRIVITQHHNETLQFNDILADPVGRVYAGTMYWGPQGMIKPGKLYLIDLDGSTRVVSDKIGMSNGVGLSPDHKTLYHADSAARQIRAFDVDPETGSLYHKRLFVQVPDTEGVPDGLTVDSEGFIWNAQWYGGQIVRYDPEGKVERRIAMPVKQVSSVAFGGADFLDLYVTSAAGYSPGPLEPVGFDASSPMGGRLYRMRVDVPGLPEYKARLALPA